MTIRGLGVAAVFLVGCAVGGASSQLAVPTASAQQATTLTKWEYRCVFGDLDEVASGATLNPFGAQGWELQAVSGVNSRTSACFKRPKM